MPTDHDEGSDSTREFDVDLDLLQRLTETGGVPGYEDRIRGIVREELTPAVDDLRSDGMGNVVGTIRGSERPDYAVVVAADEVGTDGSVEILCYRQLSPQNSR